MFSLICTGINGWVNIGEAGGLRCHRAHFDVNVMSDITYDKLKSKLTLKKTAGYSVFIFFFIIILHSLKFH